MESKLKQSRDPKSIMLVALVGMVSLIIGLAIGLVANQKKVMVGENKRIDNVFCEDTYEAKIIRNEAWQAMNEAPEIAPSTMAGDAGKVLKYMLMPGVSRPNRFLILERFLNKSIVAFDSEKEYNLWAESYLNQEDPEIRPVIVTELLNADLSYLRMMQCLMSDTGRIKKMMTGQPVPLE